MTKDVIEAIKERRSIRDFKPDPVPQQTLARILEAGNMAPSAGNVQPWHFYVFLKKESIHQLAVRCGQPWIHSAPVIVVIVADLNASEAEYGERGRTLYAIQDTAAAIQNMMLAAWAFGLGTCWIGAFNERKVADYIGVDIEKLRPVALLPIGYPETIPSSPAKKSLDEVVKIIK